MTTKAKMHVLTVDELREEHKIVNGIFAAMSREDVQEWTKDLPYDDCIRRIDLPKFQRAVAARDKKALRRIQFFIQHKPHILKHEKEALAQMKFYKKALVKDGFLTKEEASYIAWQMDDEGKDEFHIILNLDSEDAQNRFQAGKYKYQHSTS